MRKTLLFLAVMLIGLGAMAQTYTYTRITSENELNAGDKILFVGFKDGQAYAMTLQYTNNRRSVEITENGGSITTSVATSATSETEPFEFTVGGASGAWTFFDELNNGYLYAPGGGNYLKTQSALDDKGRWTLTVNEDGFYPISNGGVEQNNLRYNSTSNLFSCYKSTTNPDQQKEVYIYKAGGAPVIDPEPSNYPTGFAASINITKVTLTWTASTGAQLPRGYVVVGSTGAITVPVDGTPVENDINASDGHVAYNTTGTSVYFEQLTANTTWHFAIFPYTNGGSSINYKTDGTYPTTSINTPNMQCIFTSDFGNSLEPFIIQDLQGGQSWYKSSYEGIPFAKISGYASGAAHANEDWLITPELLNGGIYNDITVSFMNSSNYEGNALKIYMTDDYDGMSDPTEFTWQDITSDFEWDLDHSAFVWVTTSHVYNVASMGNLYIAFKYTSTDSAAATWEVADFKVYSGYASVPENNEVKFNVYPNPASNNISFVVERESEVQILDMVGHTVMTMEAVEGVNTISVENLESGVYFVKMNGAVVKFVKR